MKQIKDERKLSVFLDQYQIRSLFSTENLTFRLYQYEKGEILNFLRDSNCFLQFLVSGSVQIYAVHKDGRRRPVCLVEEFTVLGDMEFCGEAPDLFLVEATGKVICIELSLKECRESLLNDNVFLRYLLHSVAHKMAMFSQAEAMFTSLEEKLLYYFRHGCPGQELKGVDAAAMRLCCSRRQLQRLLKSLTERNIVEKLGKGTYRLAAGASAKTDGKGDGC